MLLKVDRLGPLKGSTIEFGDLTLLLGPPNSGKSYTLKSLYVKLFPLDSYTRRFVYDAVLGSVSSALPNIESVLHSATELLLKLLSRQEVSQEELLIEGLSYRADSHSVVVSVKRPVVLSFNIGEVLRRAVNAIASAALAPDAISSSLLIPVDATRAAGYISAVLSSQVFQSSIGRTTLGTIDVTESLNKLLGLSAALAEIRLEVGLIRAVDGVAEVVLLPKLRVEIGNSESAVPAEQGSAQRFASEAGKALLYRCAESLAELLNNLLRDYIEYNTGLTNMRLIPAQRDGIVLGLEHAGLDVLERLYPPFASSYAYWYTQGLKAIVEAQLEEWHRKLLSAAAPLLEGSFVTEGARILYRDVRGYATDLGLASSLARGVAEVLLPVLSSKGRALLLIEEPEARLHPRSQVLMALLLLSLPTICGCRVVATSHSDLLAITLAQLVAQKPNKEEVAELIKGLVPHASEGVDVLAEAVAESARRAVKIYWYTEEGEAREVQPEMLLREKVPSMSEVVDTLINWSTRVATSKASDAH